MHTNTIVYSQSTVYCVSCIVYNVNCLVVHIQYSTSMCTLYSLIYDCPHYLDRRNWKQRYFALREKTLFYYADSDLANAKPNGAIDLSDVR